jgi:AhpD family alkylhydroperoxidase
MSGHYHEVQKELRGPTRSLRHAIPDTWAAFGTLHQNALKDGVLARRDKELVALAIAVTSQCDGCIAAHARGAAEAGATEEQVAEVLGVCLLMAGGPASIYGPRAWEAFEEFRSAGSELSSVAAG